MKRSHFLSMAVIAILMVTLVSCATVGGMTEEYGQETAGRRVRVIEPGYGTGDILLVRDPYTGRYYQVNTYGNGFYDPFWDSRYYGNRYYGNGRSYGGGNVGSGNQSGNNRGGSAKIDEARKAIKGN